MFENRTDQALSIRLKNESGEELKSARLVRGEAEWHTVVNLPAGQYQITEAAHPGWSFNVTITEN